MLRYIFVFVGLLSVEMVFGQEFNLNVRVTAPTSSIADPSLFKSLEKEISNLMNNTTWTDDVFEDHERIQGNIQLTITEETSPTTFKGELIVQISRPVYNSTYTSPTMKYIDKDILISYDGLRPLQKTEENYIDHLSAILSFYAYYMLGVDYDSFSSLGGDKYYNKAFAIYSNLPTNLTGSGSGWSADDKDEQNRYYLLENARSPKFTKFRESFYKYHRLGLDRMYKNPIEARKILVDAIVDIGRVNKNVNFSILTKMFSDTKRLEIIDIFIVADSNQKNKVRNVMVSIDPTQSSAYRNLR